MNNFNFKGQVITRETSASLGVMAALVRAGDSNLMVSFDESDREDLMLIDEKHFDMLSLELGQSISSSQSLVDLLLPKAIVPKKITLPKSKKSAKTSTKSQLVE